MDTVGFITNLPHGLVESFKATLQELHFADLLVHVRDISHPHSDFQKDTVMKVIEEVGLPKELLNQKYIEVWNKIDLIPEEEREAFEQKMKEAKETSEHPILAMCCKDGFNKDVFLDEVAKMTNTLKGKKNYSLTYEAWQHSERLNWLMNNAKITNAPETVGMSDDGLKLTIEIDLDDVIYQQYLKKFEPE